MRPCVHVETNVQSNLLASGEELVRQTEEKCAHEHEHCRCAIRSLQEREDGTSYVSKGQNERDDTEEDRYFCFLSLGWLSLRGIYYTISAVVSRRDCRFTNATQFGIGKFFQSFLLLSLDFLFDG